ncbi:MAG: DUF302 domain-containing protein [Candidatus Hermodarchaeota archaeon]
MYGYKKELNLTFEETISKVTAELKKEGFGVLTEIDVKTTLKEKLDVDFEDYRILGACNPPFAYKSLLAERDIGLMLPCNVIVYIQDEKVYASAFLPTVGMEITENEQLKEIAAEVEEKLKRVIDNL